MAVGLANHKEMSQLVVLTTKITDYYAARNAGKTHERGKAGGVVLAESEPPFKQKFVQIVALVFSRAEGITKSPAAKKCESPINYITRIFRSDNPRPCELANGWTNS